MKLVWQLLCLGGASLVPAAASLWWQEDLVAAAYEAAGGYHVTLEKVRDWAGEVQWVDARSAPEFERSHIPGAQWINEENWEEQLPALLLAWEPDRKVVVYHRGANADASERVARRLRSDLGQQEVYILQGGFEAWQNAQR